MPMKRSLLRAGGFHALAGAITLLFCVPFVWVLVVSLRQPGLAPPQQIEWLPNPAAWSNYPTIFAMLPLGNYLLNSLSVVLISVPLTRLVAAWAGYALARLPERAALILIALAVGLRMVPATSLWLPRFLLFSQASLIDTFGALIAPALMGTSPFYVLLFYWAFRRIPAEIFESGRLDGAGAFGGWARLGMPLVGPTAVTVAVLCFVHYWSDFINPLLYLKSDHNYTLAVGLRMLQQLDPTGWPLLMAAAVVMIMPVLALFVLVQKAFVGRI
ncbi:MAG TPA: carbohydrate ABC transporter permease [Roseiflexaceae bacterium]|nr:carbohydrate ABC transporter permease [Roseiflexaceae bacterium]